MRLESKHIVGYLPYELQGLDIQGEIITLSGIKGETYFIKECSNNYAYGDIADFTPVLRPFSDKKEGFMVKRRNETYTRIDELDYLHKNHFDIYGLIENGLAIDINTIDL